MSIKRHFRYLYRRCLFVSVDIYFDIINVYVLTCNQKNIIIKLPNLFIFFWTYIA